MKSLSVLIVSTSHKSLGDTTPETGLWLDELASPYYIFDDAGELITISSPKGGLIPVDPKSEVTGSTTDNTKRFKTDQKAMYHLSHSIPFMQLQADDYDAVFIAGGHGSMFDLTNNKLLTGLLETFINKNKPIGAVGSGVVALLALTSEGKTPFVKGRKITAYSNAEVEMEGLTYEVPFLLESQLLTLGAFYSRSPINISHVVVDGKLVTGQNPASSTDTAKELLFLVHGGIDNAANIFGNITIDHNGTL